VPIDQTSLADILPTFSLSGSAVLAPIQVVSLTLAVGIFIALWVGVRLYRRWSTDRLEAFRDGEWVAPAIVEAGLPVVLETPTASGLRASRSDIRSVQKRWIALTAPADQEAPVAVGTPLSVTIRGDTALYRFHTIVLDRRVTDGVPALYVEKPARIEKVQRREHFRVGVHLPTVLGVLAPGDQEGAPIRGDIDNLSGGGFRVALPAALSAGAIVRVRLPVVTLLDYSFEARVIRCADARDFGPMRYRASCEFIRLPEETRNLIVSYCFEVQRESRTAGRN
jgi:c-di-GMP-binding flagellar brake protein YcgR